MKEHDSSWLPSTKRTPYPSTMATPLETPRRISAGTGSGVTPFKTPHRTPGEQTSQTPIVDFDLIEKHKENVAPSARGRSVHSLSQTLPLEYKQRTDKLNSERQAWEQRVTPDSLAEEDDPPAVWTKYIKWVTECYPTGGTSAESGLVPLLERATRSLMDNPRNHNRYSYVDIWIQYSRNVENPEQVLAWLISNNIGTGCAALYEEAAKVSEQRSLFESADSLFKLGIAADAEPLARLRKRYEAFKERMCQQASQHSASNGLVAYNEALASAMRHSHRSLLGVKDERTGRSQHANVMRGLGQSAGLSQHTFASLPNNGRKLNVFSDADGRESGHGKGPMSGPLPSRDVRRQENSKEAKSWGGERIPQRSGAAGNASSKTPLQVFQDSDDEEEGGAADEAADETGVSPSKRRDPFALASKPTLGSKCQESDRLRREPFGNWSDRVRAEARGLVEVGLSDIASLSKTHAAVRGPSKPAAEPSSSKRVEKPSNASSSRTKTRTTASSSSAKSKKSSAPQPAPPTTSTKRPERLAVPEHLLYPGTPTSSKESCMEEILAGLLGFALNLGKGGGEQDDPWAYLDVPAQQDQGESINMSMSFAQHEDDDLQAEQEGYGVQETPSSPSSSSSHSREGSSTPTRQEVFRTAVPSREPSITPTQSPVAIKQLQRQSDVSRARQPAAVDEDKKHLPSPTMMTKAAEAEIRALFNGGDDESEGTSSCPTSDDEDEEEAPSKPSAFAIPPTPTPASRSQAPTRSLDENAMVKATPLRPTTGRTALGSLSTATPMRKPLGTVAATPLACQGKKGIFVEEDEDEDEEQEQEDECAGPQRIQVVEEEDEESDPEEAYEYQQETDENGQLIANATFAPHELTTITERTEYETRWGMATPGRNTSVLQTPIEDDEEEDREDEQAHHPSSRSFSSEGTRPTPDGPRHSSQSGGQAKFQLSPGYTIEQRRGGHSSDEQQRESPSRSIALIEGAPNPCSPTDADVIELVLKSIARPIESSPEYEDLSGRRSEKLAMLKRQLKAQSSRKSLGSSGGDNAELVVNDIAFAVRTMLGEGAYGSVFLAEDIENQIPARRAAVGGIAGDSSSVLGEEAADNDDEGDDEDEAERKRMVAIKIETPPNKWEFYILGQMRARLEARTLRSIISARRFFAYQDESLLVLEWAEKGGLLDIVNQASAAGVAPAGAVAGSGTGVEEVLAMFFSVELLRIVENLHRAGLLHGDLKIDNCLLRLDELSEGTTWTNTYHGDGSNGWSSKGLYLVDFGRALDLSLFPPTQRFIADWETDTRDCLEMREARPWTYEVDYFGIASIAHVLLFGKYISTTCEPQAGGEKRHQRLSSGGGSGVTFKRYWQVDLWTDFFDLLLNPGSQLPIHDELKEMRSIMEAWLEENANKGGKNLKGLLKKLEIWSMNRAA